MLTLAINFTQKVIKILKFLGLGKKKRFESMLVDICALTEQLRFEKYLGLSFVANLKSTSQK